MNLLAVALIAAAAMTPAAGLAAQAAAAPPPPGAPDSLRATGELGFVATSGNTHLTTVNAAERVELRRSRFALAQGLSVVYGRSEGETTTSQWQATLRGDYAVAHAVAIYTALAWDRNRFAGLARRFEEGAGIAVAIAQGRRHELNLESGVSLVQERATTTTADDNFSAGRAAARYGYHLSETTHLRQALELRAHLGTTSDVRLNSEAALVAPLSRRLALKVSYLIRFDNRPEPGFATTDQLFTTALQVTL
jgi:putative salt-induced outer membrane protein